MSQRWLVTRSAKSMHFAVLHRAIDLRFMNFDRYVRTGESRDFHKELTQEDWVCYHSGQASQAYRGLVVMNGNPPFSSLPLTPPLSAASASNGIAHSCVRSSASFHRRSRPQFSP